MTVERVYATVADQSHEVQRAAVLPNALTCRCESGVASKRPIGDSAIDADEVLPNHAAGAEIEMPDFAVAHLAFGESHPETRCR